MARITEDREDLLREATALIPRVMLGMKIRAAPCEVFAGFRRDSLSIYFGASPVYHFNAASELRRAFLDDRLIKAQAGHLVGAVRERTPREVALVSTPLSSAESERFLAELTSLLAELRDNLDTGAYTAVGQVPDGGDAIERLRAWLVNWPGPRVADVANVS
jgi:hypothetical protein